MALVELAAEDHLHSQRLLCHGVRSSLVCFDRGSSGQKADPSIPSFLFSRRSEVQCRWSDPPRPRHRPSTLPFVTRTSAPIVPVALTSTKAWCLAFCLSLFFFAAFSSPSRVLVKDLLFLHFLSAASSFALASLPNNQASFVHFADSLWKIGVKKRNP